MDVLPEDEDVADQLTLMVATAQFKAMGASLKASSKGELNKILVELPINTTTQQASSFRPAKYMAGKSILLVDLSPQNERSLTAEFMSWNMSVTVWTIDRLAQDAQEIETDFVFINVPVDDQKAKKQLKSIQKISNRFSANTHVVLYASELQRNLFANTQGQYIFVEKPVARDQLLSALREATEQQMEEVEQEYRCENTKILIAEDNLLNQKVALRLLEQTGVMVDTCVNGKEAIEKIESGEYKLVLMDCYMPRVDGLEATRTIRKNEGETGCHIPIVAMTSEQTPELERECLAAGMDDFLTKPLQREALVEVLQRWTA
jgi:CheY-like chemotaxis protein